MGNSLVAQWLESCTSTAGGTGLIPGGVTKIPQTATPRRGKKSGYRQFWFQITFLKKNPATSVIAGKVKMIQMVINRRYQNIIEDIMIQ